MFRVFFTEDGANCTQIVAAGTALSAADQVKAAGHMSGRIRIVQRIVKL